MSSPPLLFAVSSPRRRGSRKAYYLSGFLLEFTPAKAGAGMTMGAGGNQGL